MGNTIIIAGGGHGGIALGYQLAKRGYAVTVYERRSRAQMGYDWTDIFDKKGLFAAEMELPAPERFCLKQDMTFIGPSETIKLQQHTDPDKLEIQMERTAIYDHLIGYAQEAGVRFVFDCEIEAPILLGSRVVGIQTSAGAVYGDLIVDACGIRSPLRTQLPAYLGIQNEVQPFEQFYVYRAFFNKACETKEDKFKVQLLREGKLGICWVAAEETHTDVLIGRFEPFDLAEVDRTLASLRKDNPAIGETLVRGGQFVHIPVRQPLGVLVADGYAAIGDAAFMTVPIIGSGIANSLKASHLLCEAIEADRDGAYSAYTLWKYQTDFYKELGAGLAPLACVKLLLTRLEPSDLDYIFETGILNADDMTIDADSTSLGAILGGMKVEDLKVKAGGLVKNPAVLKKILRMGKEIGVATAVTAAMPKTYEPDKVLRWVKNYNACFKH
jgi:flavin-dependent dehydrogenase